MIFVHDHKFLVCEEHVYTTGSLTNELFKRYENIFGHVDVFASKIEVPENGIKGHEVTGKKMYLFSPKQFFSIKKMATIKNIVKKEEHFVLRMPSVNGCLFATLLFMLRKPYCVEVVGCAKDALNNHGLKGKMVAPWLFWAVKFFTYRASHVLYVTEAFLQNRYQTKGVSVACSDVFITNLCDDVPKINRKEKNESLILGTAGVVDVRYKGQEYVIRALAELKNTGIIAEYWLAGPGNPAFLRECAMKYGVENQLKFVGLLNRDEINEFYRALDIYIQPSLTEGMPRAVIEAMSNGCYCLGSDVGGIPELVGKNNCFKKKQVGLIVDKIKSYYEADIELWHQRAIEICEKFQPKRLNDLRNEFYQNYKTYVDMRKG